MIADERKKRLTDAMKDAGLDALLVYGNAWQGDYLRYATDFGILEGQALAIVRSDGHITLYVDSPLEADRAALDCPGVEIVLAPDLVGEVDEALEPHAQPAHRRGAAAAAAAPHRRARERSQAQRRDRLRRPPADGQARQRDRRDPQVREARRRRLQGVHAGRAGRPRRL